MKRSIFVILLATMPAMAAEQPEYPPGLFENSPEIPKQAAPQTQKSPDCDMSGCPPAYKLPPYLPESIPQPYHPKNYATIPPAHTAQPVPQFDCFDIEYQLFPTLEAVREAHMQCDGEQ